MAAALMAGGHRTDWKATGRDLQSPPMTIDDNQHGFALALETSGPAGGVALGQAGRCVEERGFPTLRNHAAELLPTIAALCRDHNATPADLHAVFVSIGPGSFTGLRVAVTVARMFAIESEVKIVAVPTLEVLAQNALRAEPRPRLALPMIDAMRKRVFACGFELREGRYAATDEAIETDPIDRLRKQPEGTAILGGGAVRYADAIGEILRARSLRRLEAALDEPRAGVVLELGYERLDRGIVTRGRDLVPLYIRPPEAEEKWAARNG